jgi:hypothetical protein
MRFVQTRHQPAPRIASAAGIVLALTVLAGCSSGASSPGSPRADAGQAPRAAAASGPLPFARCMRRHGIQDFPDPDPSGRIAQPSNSVKASPRFAEAQKACAKYVDETEPDELTAAGRAQVADAMLAVARCMRRHGVDMSDPIVGPNSMVIRLPAGMSPGDPAVERARQKCAAAQQRVFTLIGRFPGDPGTAASIH